jgi:hypothetical protein
MMCGRLPVGAGSGHVNWQHLKPQLRSGMRTIADAVAEAALLLGAVLRAVWELVRPAFVLALNILVALILLFEEWGWRPLSNLLAWLARFRLWAMAEQLIASLPPYAALLVLAVPSGVLIPAKLIGVYMFATGHFFLAAVVIVLAKITSTALIARLFLLTKPALMQIPWFARAYEAFVPWQEALFARIRASWVWRYGRVVKWRVGHAMRHGWLTLRPRVIAAWREAKLAVEPLSLRLRSGWRQMLARLSPERRSAPRQLPPPDHRR